MEIAEGATYIPRAAVMSGIGPHSSLFVYEISLELMN